MSGPTMRVESDDRLRTLRRYLLGEVNEMSPDPERQDELRSTMVDVGRIDELLTLRAIVRDLAANEPLAEMNSDYPQYRYCLYCEANNAPGPGRPETSDPPGVVHADGCNWRKAVEWVERHD